MKVVSWRVGADNELESWGLSNTVTGTNPTDATVTATVRNRAGSVVAGLNAVAMAYVAGTTGPLVTDATGNYVSGVKYRTLAPTAAVTPPIGLYEAQVTATRAGIIGQEFVTISVEKA